MDPDEDLEQWRAVWQLRRKRALRDQYTLTQQRNRAIAIIDGETRPKNAWFVTTKGGKKSFDEDRYEQALKLKGWKGYVSNIPASIMPAADVISSYHDLWHVEQSFRMSKSDLQARPIFPPAAQSHRRPPDRRVYALAVARHLQDRSGLSLKKFVRMLRPLRTVTIGISGTNSPPSPRSPRKPPTFARNSISQGN